MSRYSKWEEASGSDREERLLTIVGEMARELRPGRKLPEITLESSLEHDTG